MGRLWSGSGFLAGQDGQVEVGIFLESFQDGGTKNARGLEGRSSVRVCFLLGNDSRK